MPLKDPIDGNNREFTPTDLVFTSFKPKSDTRPKSSAVLGRSEDKNEFNKNFDLVNKDETGLRAKGKARKDPLDGTSVGFSPPPVPSDFSYDQIGGSILKNAKK